jgi:hypothetical protein
VERFEIPGKSYSLLSVPLEKSCRSQIWVCGNSIVPDVGPPYFRSLNEADRIAQKQTNERRQNGLDRQKSLWGLPSTRRDEPSPESCCCRWWTLWTRHPTEWIKPSRILWRPRARQAP